MKAHKYRENSNHTRIKLVESHDIRELSLAEAAQVHGGVGPIGAALGGAAGIASGLASGGGWRSAAIQGAAGAVSGFTGGLAGAAWAAGRYFKAIGWGARSIGWGAIGGALGSRGSGW